MSLLSFLGRLLTYLPTLAVLALLGGVFYLGSENGWQWPPKKEKKTNESAKPNDETPHFAGDSDASSPFGSVPRSHAFDACKNEGKPIGFTDKEDVLKAGVSTGVVARRIFDNILAVTASVDHDPTRMARVSSRVGGIIWWIDQDKKEGADVKANEILAIVESGDVGKAKSAFFQAKVQLDLKQQLRNRLQAGITPEATLLAADAALREARVQLQTSYQALVNLGLSLPLAEAEKDSDALLLSRLQFLGLDEKGANLKQETTNNLIAVRNPLPDAGDILQRDGVRGEAVAAGQPIFVVGDCSRMLLWLEIRQEDQHRIKKDQPVAFYLDGDKGSPVLTKIDMISHDVDPKTRTVRARAAIGNQGHRFRAHAFGRAEITIAPPKEAVCVPEDAVQWEGCSHIVFVREDHPEAEQSAPKDRDDKKGDDDSKDEKKWKIVFKVRRVELGLRRDGFVEVIKGLKAGERIAVRGSHVLKSQLFKDRIGSAEE